MTTKRASSTVDSSTPAGHLQESGLHDVLGYQLAQASIVADGLFAQHVGESCGLRPVEYTVLTLIAENPGGSLARLARALAVTAPNVTAWVDRLEGRGLIQRVQNETDRRSQMLQATAKGVKLARHATQLILQAENDALGNLSAAEKAILLELLHKVACARPAK